MFFWYDHFGVGLFMADSFARGCIELYGPYGLWFSRKFLCLYWAMTKLTRKYGLLNEIF